MMQTKFDQLLETVQCIHILLENISKQQMPMAEKVLPKILLSARDVMCKLNISEATYYRFVRKGELRPRLKGKRHYYYEEDLVDALNESRRRGRI